MCMCARVLAKVEKLIDITAVKASNKKDHLFTNSFVVTVFTTVARLKSVEEKETQLQRINERKIFIRWIGWFLSLVTALA